MFIIVSSNVDKPQYLPYQDLKLYLRNLSMFPYRIIATKAITAELKSDILL